MADAQLLMAGFMWIVGIIMCPVIAGAKGRNGVHAFFMALFLSPVIAYLYLLAVPALPVQPEGVPVAVPVQ